MKKKILSVVALASIMVLGGCGSNSDSTTPNPTESSTANTTTSTTTAAPTTSATTDTGTTNTEVPAVATAETRHKNYLDNEQNPNANITIQGKVIHAVSFAGGSTYNIAIQEGKYGYWMNNVNKASVEIGKSYVFTGKGAKKDYPALNMKSGTITATEDIEAPILTLGDENNNFEDSLNAYMTIPSEGVVITSANQETHTFGFKIGEKEYFVSYDGRTIEAAALNEKTATLNVGCKVTKLTGMWYKENTISLYSPDEIEFSIPDAESVTISAADDATEVQATGTLQLSATVNPIAASQKVVWSSEKEDIATVSETGLVTGVKEGTTKIFATALGTDIKGEFNLTVTAAPTAAVESITLAAEDNKTGADLGETVQLTSKVLPDNALQSVTWTTSDAEVATVDDSGLVTFVGDGEVTITAHASDDSGKTGTIKLETQPANLKTASEIVSILTPLANNKTTDLLSYRGKVTAFKDAKNFIISDGTGLIQAYNFTKAPKGLKVGDIVLVKAKITRFNTLAELTDAGLTNIVISKRTIEGVPTTATKMTKDDVVALAKSGTFSKGQYIEIENAKAFKSGTHTNLNIEGTAAQVSVYAIKDYKFDLDIWGTFRGFVINTNSGYLTLWIDFFVPNATSAPTKVEITGKNTVSTGKTLTLTANVTTETPYSNANTNVTWSVANKDESITDPL